MPSLPLSSAPCSASLSSLTSPFPLCILFFFPTFLVLFNYKLHFLSFQNYALLKSCVCVLLHADLRRSPYYVELSWFSVSGCILSGMLFITISGIAGDLSNVLFTILE